MGTHKPSASDLLKSRRRLRQAYFCVLSVTDKYGGVGTWDSALWVTMCTFQQVWCVSLSTLSLAARAAIPPISEKETSLPHNCWLM